MNTWSIYDKAIYYIQSKYAKLMYVQAPPMILSVLPNGVSMASNATVPTLTKLMNYFFGKYSKMNKK